MKERSWSDIIILLLLPAPVTFIALLLGAVYIIASEDLTAETGEASSPKAAEVSTLSPNAAAIATINAAPARESADTTVNTAATTGDAGASVEVASADLGYDQATVDAGRESYLAVCSACHGVDAAGVSGLGKTLIGSEFVNGLSDADLHAFVVKGRDIWDPMNTTGVAMPARGGNPGLTDEDLYKIIAYVRVLNATSATGEAATSPETGAMTDTTTTGDAGASVEVAAADLGYDQATVDAGRESYLAVCSSCHGVDAAGVSGLGKTLIGSEFVNGLSDADLHAFVVKGRDIWDPMNTTGVAMPARGGNPGLTDEDLYKIIAYVRVLNATSDASGTAHTSHESGTTTTTEGTSTEFTPLTPGMVTGNEPATDATTEQTSTEFTPLTPGMVTGNEPAAATTAGQEFVFLDNATINAFIEGLGIFLEYAEPLPDRTGEQIYNEFCGLRYEQEYDFPAPPHFCDVVAAQELSAEALTELLTKGNPIWADPYGLGVHVAPRLGYRPLNDAEIVNFVEYLLAQ